MELINKCNEFDELDELNNDNVYANECSILGLLWMYYYSSIRVYFGVDLPKILFDLTSFYIEIMVIIN